jgi:predicted ATPase/class 3 adenylate cyclase
MKPIPSGTVTFLFTDIEGSTRLWQKFPHAMGVALSRHQELLESSIERHGGYLFQLVGDGCCAAFAVPTDAVAAALEAQRALGAERWQGVEQLRVRMALHTGAAEVRPGELRSGEYVSGITLSRAARILSVGHGAQVLLSMATAELVRDELPREVSLLDLGRHRLRDLAQPQGIYQLAAPGLRSDFPPLKTVEVLTQNLPLQLTSFIGRDLELSSIRGHLGRARLLTLTGAGGSGKTRLSIHAAAAMANEFLDGTWFVELAPLGDPTFLPTAVAHVFGLREEGLRKAEDVLMDHLRDKRLLLVVDNCEHMVEAVARFAQLLLTRCPTITILATTREALGVPGEVVFAVRPLAVPEPGARVPIGVLSQIESVRLFIDRATSAHPGFALDERNAPAIAEICVQLDGIPLAIELASARTKVLSAEQILIRLNDRFRLLTGGARTALPRQQTLRAAIDWSFDLLPGPERALLRRLCVFAGGCTLGAAEGVTTGTEVEQVGVLELLTQLENKSLLVVKQTGDAVRYDLLESVRQYGREKAVEAGEFDALRERHLHYFLALADKVEPSLYGAGQLAALKTFETEIGNLRSALDRAADATMTRQGLRLASRLGRYWSMRGDFGEGRHWMRRMLAAPNVAEHPQEHAWALYYQGYLAWFQGDVATMKRALNQSLDLARAIGNRRCAAYALDFCAIAAISERDFARAQRTFDESLALMEEVGDRWGVAFNRWHMGLCFVERQEFDQALQHWEQSLGIFQALGDKFRSGILLRVIASEHIRRNDVGRGIDLLREALRIAVERQARFEIASSLWAFGDAAERVGLAQRAAQLHLCAVTIYESMGSLAEGAALAGPDRARAWSTQHRELVCSAPAQHRILTMVEAVDLALAFQPGVIDGNTALRD